MKNRERIQQALLYLVTPEDSSNSINMTRIRGSLQPCQVTPDWLGPVKTIIWALLAIIVPLVLIAT